MPERSDAAEPVTWDDALATLEACLEAAESALELADPVGMEPFRAPPVDAPLDDDQADRARVLLARGEEVQARLEAERDRVRAELKHLPRMPATQGGTARFEVTA
jgi:hypothetical protein